MSEIAETIQNIEIQKTIKIAMVLGALIIFNILIPVISYIILKIFNLKKTKKEIKENTLYMPIKSFFRISGIYIAILFLKSTFEFSDTFMNYASKIYKVIVTITIANSLANSITRKSRLIKIIKERKDKEINDNAMRMVVRVIRILIYIIAIFIIFAEIGYDLSGLVTGLGLGSVVITLAAQDTVKNFLGGFIIYIDKPFKVDDFIKFGEYQGTVEDMTLRSTRLRTLNNSIVQVPNALIASESVENLSKIKKRRFILEIELTLDTKMEKIDTLKQKIKRMMMENQNILQDTINVHFIEISANGFKFNIACYFNVSDYIEYLDLKENLNKDIMTIINQENINLAYDTKTIEIKKER